MAIHVDLFDGKLKGQDIMIIFDVQPEQRIRHSDQFLHYRISSCTKQRA